MTSPRLVIELTVENRPKVREEAMTEAESQRLQDWIWANESIRQLVEDALMLMTGKAA